LGFCLGGGQKISDVDLFRGAAALYMATTGIIFSVLLAGLDVELTAVPWDNLVLHYIMPAAMLLDWIINRPKHRISFKRALVWLVYPLAYVAYSLGRGRTGYFTGWPQGGRECG